jgi:SagB-type dehydrogenase family enzyme
MKINFGKVFHRLSKDKQMRGMVNIPEDKSLWPDNWRIVQFKTYDRFPKIQLPEPSLDIDLATAVSERVSTRKWSDKPLTLQQISNLLYYSCGQFKDKKNSEFEYSRAQASGGIRYPVEVYVINYKKGELEQKVYHYNIKTHALDILWNIEDTDIPTFSSYEWAAHAGCMIVLTGCIDRTVSKYGERGYRYMYLEAGAIAHGINLIAKSQGMGVCLMGGTHDVTIEQCLDIDGEHETVLLGVVGGNL